MSNELLQRARAALPDGWRAMAGERETIALEREHGGETIRATVCPIGRWWRVGGADSPPMYVHVRRGVGCRGYRGRGHLERMVRDATEAAELAAGLQEEGEK